MLLIAPTSVDHLRPHPHRVCRSCVRLEKEKVGHTCVAVPAEPIPAGGVWDVTDRLLEPQSTYHRPASHLHLTELAINSSEVRPSSRRIRMYDSKWYGIANSVAALF